MHIPSLFLFAISVFFLLQGGNAHATEVVNIYTYRQPELMEPVLDAFTKETGISVQTLFLDKGLEERVLAEGKNSPVDVIMTVDIARLEKARETKITQALHDATVNLNIPSVYRDPEGHWFGLTRRARVIYAAREKVPETSITYAELANPKWKGRLCMRSGQHDYNIALFAAAIAHWGVPKTEQWIIGLKKNLARKPQGGDRLQAKAVAIEECDIALGNTYYIGLMQNATKDPDERKLVDRLKIIFPTFENNKTHINISGVAIARHAPNLKNAIKLVRFLSSEKAQQIYAEKNFEYPVANLQLSPSVEAFGALDADTLPLIKIAKYRKNASQIVDRTDFDDGPSD